MSDQRLFNDDQIWVQVRDGNLSAGKLFSRHYSKYHYVDGRKPKLFVGPGEKVVLLTKDKKALFVWRKFIDASGQKGINCAIFRNEGAELSSRLILEAEKIAWAKWPAERLYTYVNAGKIRSINPGCCYKKAGWTQCGLTKRRGLMIFEKLSESIKEDESKTN